jgi:glycosyltransferase involved in cell wall biosynthesis
VFVGCPPAPRGDERGVAAHAAKAGFAPALVLARGRGVRPFADRADVAALRRFLVEARIDLVHTWHTRDHALAWRARRAKPPAIVRSYREAAAIPATPWNRWLFGPATDALLCVSPETARRNARLRGGRPIFGAFGAVDLERFRPEPRDDAARAALGLAPEHRVVGIVARVQRHRRFDLLLAAAARLFERDPLARLLVIGRGTRREEVAIAPGRRLGIADRCVFAGYRGEDYARVLRAMDVFTYLVPGSDGTCRALLEAAACGIPAVTSRRGALPEIVRDGETGLLADEEPEALAAAWAALLGDPSRCRQMGAAARVRAETEFSPARLADAALALYAKALA